MPDIYAKEFVGVTDDTKIPSDRADARLVGYRPRGIVATKPDGVALATGDRMFVGRKRAGETVRSIAVIASASLGASTLKFGTDADDDKYAAAATMTTANKPVVVGPSAAAAAESPDEPYEDIWMVVGAAAISAGVTLQIQLEIAGLN